MLCGGKARQGSNCVGLVSVCRHNKVCSMHCAQQALPCTANSRCRQRQSWSSLLSTLGSACEDPLDLHCLQLYNQASERCIG